MKNKLKTGIYQKQNDTKLYDNGVGKYPEIKGLNFVQVYRKSTCHLTLCQSRTWLRPGQGE